MTDWMREENNQKWTDAVIRKETDGTFRTSVWQLQKYWWNYGGFVMEDYVKP